jgi:hypothetical protein
MMIWNQKGSIIERKKFKDQNKSFLKNTLIQSIMNCERVNSKNVYSVLSTSFSFC